MKWTKPIRFFLCLIVCAKNILAQEAPTFKKLEGINSKVIYCTIQDSKGFIWIGTENGVSRFDGYKFINYTMDDGLTDNDVFQIKEDSKGRLWFLNNSGKPCIYDNASILNASNTLWLNNIQPKKQACSFLQIKDGSTWYATLDSAFHIKDDKVIAKIVLPQTITKTSRINALYNYADTVFVLHNKGV